MTPYGFLLALSLMPLAMPAGMALAPSQAQPANPIGTAVLGFKERVADYIKLHKEAQSKVPKLTETNDAASMQGREAALAADDQEAPPRRQGRRRLRPGLPGGARTRGAQGFPRPLRRRSQGGHAGAAVEDEALREHDLPDRQAAQDLPGPAPAEAARVCRRSSSTASSATTSCCATCPPTSSSTSPATSSRRSRAEATPCRRVSPVCQRPPALLLTLLLGALPLAASPAPMSARAAAIQAAAPAAAAGGTLAPRAEKSLRFAVIGDSGTGDRPQYQVGERLTESRSVVPVRVRAHARRQHLRQRAAAGLREEVRAPLQGAARPEDPVLRLARQPRRSEPALLQAVQHGRRSASTRSRRATSASSRWTATTWTRRSWSGSRRS